MKFSIITAVYNNSRYIKDCIESVLSQSYRPIEYILIDGGSTDGTLEILDKYKTEFSFFLSEPDQGIYDALNKGMRAATGDVIGFLHSDDLFSHKNTLQNIANVFEEFQANVIYGDLLYVEKDNPGKIIRYWKSEQFNTDLLIKGWMPPHPTLFLKKEVIKYVGCFDINYKISADYDYIIRVFKIPGLIAKYLPEVISHMRVGGASNRTFKNIIQKSKEDYNIIKRNNIGGLFTLINKNFSKIYQFFKKTHPRA